MFAEFINLNRRVSQRWSLQLSRYRKGSYPSRKFENVLVSKLRPGMTVLDIGGGKRPAISPQRKQELQLNVIGLDKSEAELAAAPAGAYDRRILSDAVDFRLPDGVDLAFSHFVVEHVEDVRSMFINIYESLNSGGVTFHHIPNRYSLASTLNRLIPHGAKRKLLFTLHPQRRGTSGFRAYYDNCSPRAMVDLLNDIGFEDVAITSVSFSTSYFKVLFPLHLAASCWEFAAEALGFRELCADFIVEAKK